MLARLIGLFALVLARLPSLTRLGLRLHRLRRRHQAGFGAEIRIGLAVAEFAAVVLHVAIGALLLLRLILPELLLGGCDQPEIMFGMLVIILRGDRVAGRAGVARQLHVFLGDMRSGAANLDIRTVGFEHPGHRVLATPVVVIVVVIIAVVVPVTQPLVVVLTVSHVEPFYHTHEFIEFATAEAGRVGRIPIPLAFGSLPFRSLLPTIAFNRRVPQPPASDETRGQARFSQASRNKLRSLHESFQAQIRLSSASRVQAALLLARTLNSTRLLEPFDQGALSPRTLALTRGIRGASNPGPMSCAGT